MRSAPQIPMSITFDILVSPLKKKWYVTDGISNFGLGIFRKSWWRRLWWEIGRTSHFRQKTFTLQGTNTSTYPIQRHFLMFMCLFPRWDMWSLFIGRYTYLVPDPDIPNKSQWIGWIWVVLHITWTGCKPAFGIFQGDIHGKACPGGLGRRKRSVAIMRMIYTVMMAVVSDTTLY